MRHAYVQSLSSEETTLIRKLTREIMNKEGLSHVRIQIKPKVWKTVFIIEGILNRITKEFHIEDQFIQFGGKMLTGSKYPKSIYYISVYDPEYKLCSIRIPIDVMLADVVASTILEEIAHAVVFNRVSIPQRRKAKSHGNEFKEALILLWKEYFLTLKFRLMEIYGSNGISGEDAL